MVSANFVFRNKSLKRKFRQILLVCILATWNCKKNGKIIRENAFEQKEKNSRLKFNPLSAQKSGTIEPAVWIAGVIMSQQSAVEKNRLRTF